jgi:hypothetical protein
VVSAAGFLVLAAPGGLAEGVEGAGVGVEGLQAEGGGDEFVEEQLIGGAVDGELGAEAGGVVGEGRRDGGGGEGHGAARVRGRVIWLYKSIETRGGRW